mmetsp:Transcript_36660/g.117588  ORF Transcript_36660/g.117588 Transcript_36660/m.117588 type:complete len:366 (-) Transcript_36660:4796-5893(-)
MRQRQELDLLRRRPRRLPDGHGPAAAADGEESDLDVQALHQGREICQRRWSSLSAKGDVASEVAVVANKETTTSRDGVRRGKPRESVARRAGPPLYERRPRTLATLLLREPLFHRLRTRLRRDEREVALRARGSPSALLPSSDSSDWSHRRARRVTEKAGGEVLRLLRGKDLVRRPRRREGRREPTTGGLRGVRRRRGPPAVGDPVLTPRPVEARRSRAVQLAGRRPRRAGRRATPRPRLPPRRLRRQILLRPSKGRRQRSDPLRRPRRRRRGQPHLHARRPHRRARPLPAEERRRRQSGHHPQPLRHRPPHGRPLRRHVPLPRRTGYHDLSERLQPGLEAPLVALPVPRPPNGQPPRRLQRRSR